jgi:hypothetical protein
VTEQNAQVLELLAAAQERGYEVAVPDVPSENLPEPPVGSSPAATALWFALLKGYTFSLGEMAVLEEVVRTKSLMDEVEADWRRDGSPKQAKGSTGQPVVDPRIAELRVLRSQYAALIRDLKLPSENGEQTRRPGRPTRAASPGTARWGH